ncbi:MAG TPA: DUF4236 domain-containing protein [Chloroflexi bacterium]|jgi:hypothetical protein|nr:DUF4236 domain-containing protein [Chloroflexota bacterium]
MKGWRFRRSKKILPGVRVNISRGGPSISLGRRGARMTIGRCGITRTVGIPGTGVYHTRRISSTGSTGSGCVGCGCVLPTLLALLAVGLALLTGA